MISARSNTTRKTSCCLIGEYFAVHKGGVGGQQRAIQSFLIDERWGRRFDTVDIDGTPIDDFQFLAVAVEDPIAQVKVAVHLGGPFVVGP